MQGLLRGRGKSGNRLKTSIELRRVKVGKGGKGDRQYTTWALRRGAGRE